MKSAATKRMWRETVIPRATMIAAKIHRPSYIALAGLGF